MVTTQAQVSEWLVGRIPDGWFAGPLDIEVDADEILVVGALAAEPDSSAEAKVASPEARISRFRERSRGDRMRIAEEGQRRFRRKISWGARCEGVTEHFTTLSLPVMTRLRHRERQVLDTLIAAGVARSRSEALNWCVRLVAERQADWLANLKSALSAVEQARAKGPHP